MSMLLEHGRHVGTAPSDPPKLLDFYVDFASGKLMVYAPVRNWSLLELVAFAAAGTPPPEGKWQPFGS